MKPTSTTINNAVIGFIRVGATDVPVFVFVGPILAMYYELVRSLIIVGGLSGRSLTLTDNSCPESKPCKCANEGKREWKVESVISSFIRKSEDRPDSGKLYWGSFGSHLDQLVSAHGGLLFHCANIITSHISATYDWST